MIGNTKHNKGFTVAESLITVLIIAILMGIAVPSLIFSKAETQKREAESYAGVVLNQLTIYRISNKEYTNDVGLLKLKSAGPPNVAVSWDGKFEVSLDPCSTDVTQCVKGTLSPTTPITDQNFKIDFDTNKQWVLTNI